MINNLSNYIAKILDLKNEYVYLAFISIISYVLIKITSIIIIDLYNRHSKNSKDKYIKKQKIKLLTGYLIVIVLFIIWEKYLKNLITIISFISAGATIALREIIFNYFSGIYLKIKKPFKIEDRIEINGFKGDVVKITYLSFEILEVGEEQSTGKTIHLPNSYILTYPLKNFVKPFKYIWNEMELRIPIDSDIKQTKKILYRIINSNQVVRSIPPKMRRQINNSNSDYRIYFNKFTPFIYTTLKDDYVLLSVRFLIHPKKVRNVEDEIWFNIIKAHNNGEISLYIK